MTRLILPATSVVARLIGGQIATVAPMTAMTATFALIQAFAAVFLAFAMSTTLLFGAIIVFGATIGNILMLQPLLIAERFGVRDYPRIYSRGQLFTLVGTAGGPLLLGALHDLSDGYELPYVIAGVCSLVGVGVILWAGPADDRSSNTEGAVA